MPVVFIQILVAKITNMACDLCGASSSKSLQYYLRTMLHAKLPFCTHVTCFCMQISTIWDYMYSLLQLTDLEKACQCCPQLCWCLKYRSEAIHLSQGFPNISGPVPIGLKMLISHGVMWVWLWWIMLPPCSLYNRRHATAILFLS